MTTTCTTAQSLDQPKHNLVVRKMHSNSLATVDHSYICGCMCVYVCICLCMYMYVCVCNCMHMYACVLTFLYVCIRMNMQKYLYTYTCTVCIVVCSL